MNNYPDTKKMVAFLRSWLGPVVPYVFLVGLVVIISIVNYQPGTYLSGWDNLHPEFDFGMNIRRSFFAVWQEYQGLGLLGGMGHAADLPRQLLLWGASILIPQSANRYVFHFTSLLFGVLGMYVLGRDILFARHSSTEKMWGSLCAAIFYLCNLATVQMFQSPFEPYSVHFAAIPWLFWANIRFFQQGQRKQFIWLVLVNLLAVPQGYIATFFLVYVLCLSLVTFPFLFRWQRILRVVVAYSVLLAVNAFWLVPNLYFVATKVQVNVNAKINQMTTRDMFLRNQKYGDIQDVLLFKGFWFDNVEADKNGVIHFQMEPWIVHLQQPGVTSVGYGLIGVALLGVGYGLAYRKKFPLFFLPPAVLAYTLLANDTPVFSVIAEWIYKIPLVSQVFRFPFTKWSIMCVALSSMFYAIGVTGLVTWLRRYLRSEWIFIVFIGLPVLYVWPMFEGNLFYFKERAAIPSEYFQTMEFFHHQDLSERIANFPQFTYLGWAFYRWEYSGSGFLWYGIEQPILDRAFDVWSSEDENYYNELSLAVYSGNKDAFSAVLDKYQMRWLLVDGNMISPFSAKSEYNDKLRQLIASMDAVHLMQTYGKITIYRVDGAVRPNQFVYLGNNLPVIGPGYQWDDNDQAFTQYGTYISGGAQSSLASVYYPFRSLFTGRTIEQKQIQITQQGDQLHFTVSLPSQWSGETLLFPPLSTSEVLEVQSEDLSTQLVRQPVVTFNKKPLPVTQFTSSVARSVSPSAMQQMKLPQFQEGTLDVQVPLISGINSLDSAQEVSLAQYEAKACQTVSGGMFQAFHYQEAGSPVIHLKSLDAKGCLDIDVPGLAQKRGYLIKTITRHVSGKPLLFWLENLNSRKADIETLTEKDTDWQTDYYIQPPMEEFGQGYTIHFANESIGREETINDIKEVSIYPLPYNFLKSIQVVRQFAGNERRGTITANGLDVQHPNTSMYLVHLPQSVGSGGTSLILSQSYDPGWKAYPVTCAVTDTWCRLKLYAPFLFFNENNSHVQINNWSQGWLLPKQQDPATSIVIIYVPQYFEYIGLVVLVGVIVLTGVYTGELLIKKSKACNLP